MAPGRIGTPTTRRGIVAGVSIVVAVAALAGAATTSTLFLRPVTTMVLDAADAEDERLQELVRDLDGLATDSRTVVTTSRDILGAADPAFIEDSTIDALDEAVRGLDDAVGAWAVSAEERGSIEGTIIPAEPSAGDPVTALLEIGRTLDGMAVARTISPVLQDRIDSLSAVHDEAVADRSALFASLDARGSALLAASPNARVVEQLGFTELGIGDDDPEHNDVDVSAWGMGRYVSAARAIVDSHARETADRSDPALALRTEIEDYARSLSSGVDIDVEWAYTVAGLSSDEWISGTAEFRRVGERRVSVITLSDSIESTWYDSADARALVVHEVGHGLALRPECEAVLESPMFGTDHEAWATAWAIGMGFDVPGSGIEAYGRPTAEQIEATRICR